MKARTAAKSRPRAQDDHRAEVPASSIGGAPSDGGTTAQTSVIRDLLRDQSKRSQDRGKASISQVKLETFKGRREHLKDWKKTLEAQRLLYRLTDEELAMLVFLSTAGEAREVVNQLEVSEMNEPGGLNRMMKLLEDAYGTRSDERFEEKQDCLLYTSPSPRDA